MKGRPKNMLAAILVEQNKPLVIDEIELPDELSYGQVLVKVVCSGICGSQIGEIDGVKGPDKFLPHLLGHEGGGIVENVGYGVARVKKGDHVSMHWRKGVGIESPAPKYKWRDRIVNSGWVTTFNEFAVVSENRLTPIPIDIDFEIAALMGCAVTTGLGIINNNAKLKIGESIVIFGVGGVGLNVVQGASLSSANPIIAIDIYDHKLELAKEFGATHLINSSKSDVKEEIFKIVGNGGVDVAVDNTGNVRVIEQAYEVTSASGRTILVGVPKAGEKVSIYTLPLHFEKVLTGSHGGESNPSVDIPKYIRLVESGRLGLKKMITHRFRLDEINLAIEKIRSGEVVRCIIAV
ncbi:MAG TPA: zinc-binding dehydrogenase [Nitrospirota bacterium]|nr:zinc-binding dehydrogenase [Nitrospirota bacterium]